MRLLFLGVHDRNRSPSQRYRFEQFLPALGAAGVEVDYSGALTFDEATTFYSGKTLAKVPVALRGLTRRLQSLTRLGKTDVVWVQREAFFLFNEWSEWLASKAAPVVWDFDDAVWIHAISEANRRFAFLKNVNKIPRIAALAHTVLAGNDYLANWARQYARDVRVVPTVVDTNIFTPPPTPRGRDVITIGWSGSQSTIEHLKLALPALEQVKARFKDRVRLRVMGDPNFRYEPLGLVGEQWSPAAEVRFLQDMHVGLMPLPDDEWAKGKCGLKALTSMASGAATVLSPVGVNPTLVHDGVHGRLASTTDEWVQVLSELIENHDLREQLGAAGRQRVISEYSVQRWAPELVKVLTDAANSR